MYGNPDESNPYSQRNSIPPSNWDSCCMHVSTIFRAFAGYPSSVFPGVSNRSRNTPDNSLSNVIHGILFGSYAPFTTGDEYTVVPPMAYRIRSRKILF